jgi:hypothetical protein
LRRYKIKGSKHSADAVDKIKCLEILVMCQLKGLENNNDDVAINIKLKSGKKNFWLDIAAGTDLVNVISSIQNYFTTVPKLVLIC